MPSKHISDIISQCISETKSTSPTTVLSGVLYRWKGHVVDFLTGTIELNNKPIFSITINDHTGCIPCVISDPARHVIQILKLCSKKIVLRRPQFVTEIYVIDNNENVSVCMYLKCYDIHTINNGSEQNVTVTHSANDFPTECKSIERKYSYNYTEYMIKVLHVASPILSYKSEPYCLVLVQLLNPDMPTDKNVVWLVLKEDHTSWYIFLIPNRFYKLLLPQANNENYFTHQTDLHALFKHVDRRFREMLHHKHLIISNKMVSLPSDAKILIMPSCTISSSRQNNKWINISDVDKVQRFTSIFGTIKDVLYTRSWKTAAKCIWCENNNSVTAESDGANYNTNNKYGWINPWIEETPDIPADGLLIPNSTITKNTSTNNYPFGIRNGDICIQICLYDEYTNHNSFVYLKDWKNQLYPFGLMQNATICFTNVYAACSKKNNLYYISTPLTQLVYLDVKSNNVPVSNAIVCKEVKFGFSPAFKSNLSDTIWIPIDLELVTKCSISKRCKQCGKKIYDYRCNNVSCALFLNTDLEEYEACAVLNMYVKLPGSSENIQLRMYDEIVKKYFNFPNNMWNNLLSLASKFELLYFFKNKKIPDQSADQSIFNIEQEELKECFHYFCKHFTPTRRYHAICKPIVAAKRAYRCIELNEIDSRRLAVMHKVCVAANIATS